MLFKVSISGQRSKRSIDIGKNTCVLGRGKDCDIDINEDLVSRKHLKISMEMDLLYIEELGSSNGSWLNSQQLLAGKKTIYNPGDIIHLGKDESGVSIVIENLCIKQAVKNTSSEKTLIFAIPAKFEKQIVEINTKLVANGAPISYPVESSQATKPFMKIVPNISEHRHGLEDKVKNLLNQEAEKLLQLAAHDSSEMKKKAELEEKQILEQAHLEAKKIIENAEIEAQKHKNNVEEELRLIKEKNKSIRFETEELLKKHKTTTAQIENVIKNLVNEEARVQQNIKSLEYGVLSIQDKIKSETALLNDIKSDTATLKKTVEMKLEEVVMEERRARARIETEILESRIQTSKIFAEAEKLQSQKYNIEAEISDLRSGKGQVEREVNELQISFKRQEYDLEKLGREYSNLSNEKLKLQASYEALINEDKKLTDKYVVRENALIEEQKQLQKEISELKDEAIEIIEQAEKNAHYVIQTAQERAASIAEEAENQLKELDLEKSEFYTQLEIEKKNILQELNHEKAIFYRQFELEKSTFHNEFELEKKNKLHELNIEINAQKTHQLAELKTVEEKKLNTIREIKWQEENFNKKCEKIMAHNLEEIDGLKAAIKVENEHYKAKLDHEHKILKAKHLHENESFKAQLIQENEASKAHTLIKLQELKTLALKQISDQKNKMMMEINAKNEEIILYSQEVKLKAEKVIKEEKEKLEAEHERLIIKIRQTEEVARRHEAALVQSEVSKEKNLAETNKKIEEMLLESRTAIALVEREAAEEQEKKLLELERLKDEFEQSKISDNITNAEATSLAVKEFLTLEMIKQRNLVLSPNLIKKIAERAGKLVIEAYLGRIQASGNEIKISKNKNKKSSKKFYTICGIIVLFFMAHYIWTNYANEILTVTSEVNEYVKENKISVDKLPSKNEIIEALR